MNAGRSFAVVVATLLIAPAAALGAQTGPTHFLHYPIHYDGPRVRHGSAQRALRADVTDGLPTFNVTFHGGPVQIATTSYTIF